MGGGPGLDIPSGVRDPWRGSPDDGTFGYGTGVNTAQLPNSAWKALHPGGQASDDSDKTPPPGAPVDPKKKPQKDRTPEDDKKALDDADRKDDEKQKKDEEE